MIKGLLELLEINKKIKTKSRYIVMALGDNKYPQTYREAIKLFRRHLWRQEKK